MPSVIKAAPGHVASPGASFNLNDVVHQANRYLQDVQRQAEQIRLRAGEEADRIRQEAEQQGRQAALSAVDQLVQERIATELKTLVPALQSVVAEMERLKQQWQLDWQQRGVHLAVRIAERLIRRELQAAPQISQALVAEALEMASGSRRIRVRLNPADHALLAEAGTELARIVSQLAPADFQPDEAVAPGGCHIQTEQGTIDARLETQLQRIEAELNP